MTNYTFAELLTVFFHLHQDVIEHKTQSQLAEELNISRRTLINWFAGDYVPRNPEVILKLARSLCLTSLQTDLLLYAVNPTWVKYDTPAHVLEAAHLVRYREEDIESAQPQVELAYSITEIEQQWQLIFCEDFEKNYQRWGEGEKRNGIAHLTRTIQNGYYRLTLQNQYHEDVFLGGDSNCLTPPIYYIKLKAKMIEGESEADGYGILFEEINDECYALLRIREKQRRCSVVQTRDGGNHANVYIRQKPIPAIRPGEYNQLAILAIHNEHWFYVNDTLIGYCLIPRIDCSRLDVGIIAGEQQLVICDFTAFSVYSPSVVTV